MLTFLGILRAVHLQSFCEQILVTFPAQNFPDDLKHGLDPGIFTP